MKIPIAARRLLLTAAQSLEEECDAAGPDEVAEHPDLKNHADVAARIRRYLKRTKETS